MLSKIFCFNQEKPPYLPALSCSRHSCQRISCGIRTVSPPPVFDLLNPESHHVAQHQTLPTATLSLAVGSPGYTHHPHCQRASTGVSQSQAGRCWRGHTCVYLSAHLLERGPIAASVLSTAWYRQTIHVVSAVFVPACKMKSVPLCFLN